LSDATESFVEVGVAGDGKSCPDVRGLRLEETTPIRAAGADQSGALYKTPLFMISSFAGATTFSITTFSITTLSITKFSITTFCITKNKSQHSA
jgi:hypothetical protein